jgi:hypothetical protein
MMATGYVYTIDCKVINILIDNLPPVADDWCHATGIRDVTGVNKLDTSAINISHNYLHVIIVISTSFQGDLYSSNKAIVFRTLHLGHQRLQSLRQPDYAWDPIYLLSLAEYCESPERSRDDEARGYKITRENYKLENPPVIFIPI